MLSRVLCAQNTWTDLPNAVMKVARSDLCADTINGKVRHG
jgi:hypothetical protein